MRYLMQKRSRKWRGFFLLAFLPVLLPAQTPNGKAIQEHYQRAQDAGQNEIAVKEFREVLQLDPHNAEAHVNLGVIAYTEKNYAGAEDEFRDALNLHPSLWNA